MTAQAVRAGVDWSEPLRPAPARLFTPEEQVTANALCERLLALTPDCPVPVVARIEARLAEQERGDLHGGHAADAKAWRSSLEALKHDALERFQSPFAVLDADRRDRLILRVRDLGARPWHGMLAHQVWSLWTRYACAAFYSHPFAWNEAGFRA